MAEARIECVWPVGAKLGEGPFWSAAEEALWFVDIKSRKIHRFHEPTGDTRSWDAPPDPSFILPTHDGGYLVGLRAGLHRFDPESGSFSLLSVVEPDASHNRLNDAYVDADGYLWFGSMDDNESEPTGALYQLTKHGCVRRDAPYVITNGPCVCNHNRTLYHTDTLKKEIYAFAKTGEGEISGKRLFATMAPEDGYPDGPLVDSTGTVWSALYGGWGVNRYTPEGRLLGKLKLPCANVTKVAFGGRDLRTLYITTAWKGMTSEQRAAQPLAGGLFRIRVDVAGQPQNTIAHGV
jgi:xylono-1,5-lactonase